MTHTHRSVRRNTVQRAFSLLNAMGRADYPLGVTELGRKAGVAKATAHRLLKALEDVGCVLFDPTTESYRLGPTLIELGIQARNQLQLATIARPVLERLALGVGETINIGVLHGDHVLVLDTVRHLPGPKLTVDLGPVAELHCSSLGKALMAWLPPAQLDSLLDRMELARRTPHTVTDRDELARELAEIRKTGIAYDREESELGLLCVATPVCNSAGWPVTAISVSGPVSRMQGSRLRMVEEACLEAGRQLAALLGYTADGVLLWRQSSS